VIYLKAGRESEIGRQSAAEDAAGQREDGSIEIDILPQAALQVRKQRQEQDHEQTSPLIRSVMAEIAENYSPPPPFTTLSFEEGWPEFLLVCRP
jgi:hypothetical protein